MRLFRLMRKPAQPEPDTGLKRLKKYLEIFLNEQIELAQDSKSN